MSNGNHTPERCVHAPDGPDWAGLRELPTPKPNYKALVTDARFLSEREWQTWWPKRAQRALASVADAVEALLAMEQRLTDHIVQLAAERDALDRALWVAKESQADLIKENEKLREAREETERQYQEAVNRGLATMDERDALRIQLAEMTVETRRLRYPDKGRLMTTAAPVITESRRIGPWTVVEGDDQ